MIASVKGNVVVRRPDHVVLEAAGVGYRLAVSAQTLRAVPPSIRYRRQWYAPAGMTTPSISNGSTRRSPTGTALNSMRSPLRKRQLIGAQNTR